MAAFSPANILLPDPSGAVSIEKWSVVACDQFTSQPQYWKDVRSLTEGFYSTVNLILPEAELAGKSDELIKGIHRKMADYKADGIYKEYPSSLVYVERTQSDGSTRRGIVGCIDLEDYDYSPDSSSLIRATEKTVIERIPPRVAVREGAPTELSHVILYAHDEADALISPITDAKASCPLLYDFDLMKEGGHISGYLISGAILDGFMKALDSYYQLQDQKAQAAGRNPVYFTVADGNHSLASAKECYERAKREGRANDRLRFAMVELENLHDSSQVVLPIHRLIKGADAPSFLHAMEDALKAAPGSEGTLSLPWLCGSQSGEIALSSSDPGTAFADIQAFIDRYLAEHEGSVDYIHGDETIRQLASEEGSIGFIMPAIAKDGFFDNIMKKGVYPRKTFSVGEATDKRYYLEARDLY